MNSRGIKESVVEQAALAWLESVGWQTAHGPDIERDYSEVILEQRLHDALAELNPDLPSDALESAFRKLSHPEGSTLVARNREFHRMFVWGVTVEYRTDAGAIRGAQVRVVDFDEPTANDWLAVNQVTVTENKHTRPARCCAVCERPTLGGHRAEEPGGRERHHLGRLAAAADVQVGAAHVVLDERDADGLGRSGRLDRHADGGQGVVQGRGARFTARPARRRPAHARAAGDAGGRLRAGALPQADPRLHRLR